MWYSFAWGQNAKGAEAPTDKLKEAQLVRVARDGTAKNVIVGTHQSQNYMMKRQKNWRLKHICRESAHEEQDGFSVAMATPSPHG